MKRILLLIAICLCFVSCGPALKRNGQFGSETYIGNFRDVAIYEVVAPSGRYLYIGVREDGSVASTQYNTGGKSSVEVPVIIIDGEKKTVKEAKKMLEEY